VELVGAAGDGVADADAQALASRWPAWVSWTSIFSTS
jgi:hypothetical protein